MSDRSRRRPAPDEAVSSIVAEILMVALALALAAGAWLFFSGSFGMGDGNEIPDEADQRWSDGGVLYVPCQEEGDHSTMISLKGTTVLDSTVSCDTQATKPRRRGTSPEVAGLFVGPGACSRVEPVGRPLM